jgi:acetyltransferase-like isoleucine patch superfamily enzyme
VKNGETTLSTNMKKLGAFVGDDVVIGAGNTVQPGTVVLPGKNLPACYSVTNKT